MVSGFNNELVLGLGFAEAVLGALSSPMTQGVFVAPVRVLSFALAAGCAAVMHLAIQLGQVKKADGTPVTTDEVKTVAA